MYCSSSQHTGNKYITVIFLAPKLVTVEGCVQQHQVTATTLLKNNDTKHVILCSFNNYSGYCSNSKNTYSNIIQLTRAIV